MYFLNRYILNRFGEIILNKGETGVNIKQFLNQGFRLNALIQTNQLELEQLRALSTSIGVLDLSKERVQTSGQTDRVVDTVARIIDLEAAIQDDINCYLQKKQEIRALIMTVEDDSLKLILQKRYLIFEEWKDIAIEMGFDIDANWIFELHRRALSAAKKNYSENITIHLDRVL
jgi:hypothetical protein